MPAATCPIPVSDDLLAGLDDALVAQVLVAKSAEDRVPMAAWWLVADALRLCAVATRQASAYDVGPGTSPHVAPTALQQALDAAEVALDKLAERCGIDRSPAARLAAPADVAAVRLADLRLARLFVSVDPTPPTLLLVRVESLLSALAGWRAVEVAAQRVA